MIEDPQAIPSEILKQKRAIDLYLIAVLSLAIIGVLSILGGIALAWVGKTVPGELWTFSGIAITGLVAMVSRDQSAGA